MHAPGINGPSLAGLLQVNAVVPGTVRLKSGLSIPGNLFPIDPNLRAAVSLLQARIDQRGFLRTRSEAAARCSTADSSPDLR